MFDFCNGLNIFNRFNFFDRLRNFYSRFSFFDRRRKFDGRRGSYFFSDSFNYRLRFFRTVQINNCNLFAENRDIISQNFAYRTIRRANFALFNFAVFAYKNFRNFALNCAGFCNCLRSENTNVFFKHSFIFAGLIEFQNFIAVNNCNCVVANGDNRGVGDQFNAAIPFFVFDCNCRHDTFFGVNQQSFAYSELATFGNADYRQAQNIRTFFHLFTSKYEFIAVTTAAATKIIANKLKKYSRFGAKEIDAATAFIQNESAAQIASAIYEIFNSKSFAVS